MKSELSHSSSLKPLMPCRINAFSWKLAKISRALGSEKSGTNPFHTAREPEKGFKS